MTSTSQVAGPPGPDLDLLEYVLVSAPSPSALAEVAGAVAELVAAGVPRRQAAELVSRLTGASKNVLYRGSL